MALNREFKFSSSRSDSAVLSLNLLSRTVFRSEVHGEGPYIDDG